jgi:hypothetical protein
MDMDITNEPVAWLIQTKTAHQFTFKEPTIIPLDAGVIPLYTHPVKELTDAEIIKLFENDELWFRSSIVYQDDAINFARAILRKAQEK